MREVKIGLEVHVQVKTESKLFSCASTCACEGENGSVNFLDLGYPGVLPLLNEKALELAARTGFALDCDVQERSEFDRKHYFYPDSPLGYQITQQYYPICIGGFLEIGDKKIRLNRIHLETDAGKMIHGDEYSYLDFNRCGVPLMEIVTEPDMNEAMDAVNFANELILVLEYIKTSNCNMEDGDIRFDVNVSIDGGERVETKNINSIKFMKDAINYEIERQGKIVDAGEKINRETRSYDSQSGTTILLREKENEADYRYMKDNNIPPVILNREWLNSIQKSLPKLPKELRKTNKDLHPEVLEILIRDQNLYNFFESVVSEGANRRLAANFIASNLWGLCKAANIKIEESQVTSECLNNICILIENEDISLNVGKILIGRIFETGESIDDILKNEDWKQIKDRNILEKIIDDLITEGINMRHSKEKALEFLIGKIMGKTKGKAHAGIVRDILEKKLENLF